MECSNPYIPQGYSTVPAPCRKCMACKVNHKRLWQHRLILESLVHEKQAFVTLTYDDDSQPSDGSVSKKELQDFHKRLRKRFKNKIRYFAVGEYGTNSLRPHYHGAYFGIRCDLDGGCNLLKKKAIRKFREKLGQDAPIKKDWYIKKICSSCKKIEDAWNNGFIDVSPLNQTTAGYILGYCVKKMTNPEDDRLKQENGKYLYPEFALMSKNLGVTGMYKLLDEFKMSDHFERFLTPMGDVPFSFNHGGKSYPLGRHLREKGREYLQLEKAYDTHTGEIKYVPKEAEKKVQEEKMRILRLDEEGRDPSEKTKITQQPIQPYGSLKHYMHRKNHQRNLNIEKRQKIFKKENKL
jgi:hypothetical protein